MEIMLGKKTYYDKLPQIMWKLEALLLSGLVKPDESEGMSTLSTDF